MSARRDVGRAGRVGDLQAVRQARLRVNRAKRALGERGPAWWSDGAPDYNRRLVQNTPYADWYFDAERIQEGVLTLLADRADASICPSDAARAARPQGWRAHMDLVRTVARHLARRGLLVITQRGRTVDPGTPPNGPIRLALPKRPRFGVRGAKPLDRA